MSDNPETAAKAEVKVEKDIRADVEIHGSVARDTWLKDQRDVDVFIVLDRSQGREGLYIVNDAIKVFLGDGWVEAYAEHPYVKAELEGYDVEFIPCFQSRTWCKTSFSD